MKQFLMLLFILSIFSCKEKQVKIDQPIFDRIEFVFNLKETIDKEVWNTFNDKKYDLPLVYFTDSSTYIANPTEKFMALYKPVLVHETSKIKIYKNPIILDSIPFHMETGLTMGTPTDEFNYHSPFMMCSSFEIVHNTIPKIISTEQWTTMILHEYFHGFQYKHPAYIDYYEKNIAQIQPDSLVNLYKHNSWYKKSIDTENDYLLKAIAEKDNAKTYLFIDSFFSKRQERRNKTRQELQFDVSQYENCYETMEGTARYVEYSLYKKYASEKTNETLAKTDSSFKAYSYFKNYNIEKDQWLFLTSKTSYHYAIGFNMTRLLDKLNITYKARLFNEASSSLEGILMEGIKVLK
jgi:hypothetical protein